MIESYLRANNMFVDYNEVWTFLISLLYFIYFDKILNSKYLYIIAASARKSIHILSAVRFGTC